jgi:hypothetical protein
MWWPFAKRGARTDAPLALNLPVALPTNPSFPASLEYTEMEGYACAEYWLA